MRVAADVLHAIDPALRPPESVREGEAAPRAIRSDVAGLPGVVARELAAIGEGRLGVVTSDVVHGRAAALFPDGGLDAPVAVLTVTQAKGLEFDGVVVVDPAGIMAQSPMGTRDLYVAITRATRRLTVVHEGELPALLTRLVSESTL
jgi:hypothetical protein